MQPHLIEKINQKLGVAMPSPVQSIDLKNQNGSTSVMIKRDDLIHPIISGNKYRKLRYNLEHCISNEIKEVVSFGGAYSNHLHALAYCCQSLDIQLHAIIRGERPTKNVSKTLVDIESWGTKTIFVSRSIYRRRNDPLYLKGLTKEYPNALLIPEGGSNELGVNGVSKIWQELAGMEVDILICPIGSGGTFKGLMKHKPKHIRLVGVSALKGINWYDEFQISPGNEEFEILDQYHFGGFAKFDKPLIEYIEFFEKHYSIPLDYVYTAKMFYGIQEQLSRRPEWQNKRIMAIHTGGLQGRQLF